MVHNWTYLVWGLQTIQLIELNVVVGRPRFKSEHLIVVLLEPDAVIDECVQISEFLREVVDAVEVKQFVQQVLLEPFDVIIGLVLDNALNVPVDRGL